MSAATALANSSIRTIAVSVTNGQSPSPTYSTIDTTTRATGVAKSVRTPTCSRPGALAEANPAPRSHLDAQNRGSRQRRHELAGAVVDDGARRGRDADHERAGG